MKVIAKFETGERVVVERYEQEQKVGSRRLYFNDYVAGLMNELHIGDIIHNVISRDDEYQDYLTHLEQSEEFTDFLVQTIKYADRFRFEANENIQSFVYNIFKKIDLLKLHSSEIENLFIALTSQIKELPNEPMYVDLLNELLKKVIAIDSKKDIINKVFPSIVKMANEIDSPLLKEWFELAIPHLDYRWLLNALEKLNTGEEMKIAEIENPKNCVLTMVTTKRQIFVLEIPKSRFRVKFHNVAVEDVGHPRLACILHLQQNQVTKMKLVAVPDKGEITKETPVYHYPYSNVFGDGNVCWNGFKDEKIQSARDLSIMPMLFLSGTNNTHLRGNVRELFEANQGKDYPSEQLQPFGKKLKELLN